MDIDNEIWRPVVGYENHYEVSNLGKIASCERILIDKDGNKRKWQRKILKPRIAHNGYLRIGLSAEGIRVYKPIHRLIAIAFISPPPSSQHQINHIDMNKSNNRVDNLEWVLPQENTLLYRIFKRGWATKDYSTE